MENNYKLITDDITLLLDELENTTFLIEKYQEYKPDFNYNVEIKKAHSTEGKWKLEIKVECDESNKDTDIKE